MHFSVVQIEIGSGLPISESVVFKDIDREKCIQHIKNKASYNDEHGYGFIRSGGKSFRYVVR